MAQAKGGKRMHGLRCFPLVTRGGIRLRRLAGRQMPLPAIRELEDALTLLAPSTGGALQHQPSQLLLPLAHVPTSEHIESITVAWRRQSLLHFVDLSFRKQQRTSEHCGHELCGRTPCPASTARRPLPPDRFDPATPPQRYRPPSSRAH